MAITQVGLVGPFGLSNNEIGKQILQILIGSFGTSGSLDGSPSLTEASHMEFGGIKSMYVGAGQSASGGTVYWAIPLEDTVLTTLTAASGYTTSGLAGPTLPAGIPLTGRYSALTVNTGGMLVFLI